MPRMDPKQIEELKSRRRFDEQLPEHIVPVGHPQRVVVEDDVFHEQIVANIKNEIDGIWVEFLADGCRRVPRRVISRRPTKVKNKFTVTPQLEVYLRGFIAVYFKEAGLAADVKEIRRALAQAVVLFQEIIRRSRLAKLLDYD